MHFFANGKLLLAIFECLLGVAILLAASGAGPFRGRDPEAADQWRKKYSWPLLAGGTGLIIASLGQALSSLS